MAEYDDYDSYEDYTDEPDQLDRQILKLLQADARMPHAEIGKKVGLSRQAVTKRVKSLEDWRYIRGYTVVTDHYEKNVNMAVIFTVAPEHYKKMLEVLKKQHWCELIMRARDNRVLAFCSFDDMRDFPFFMRALALDVGNIENMEVLEISRVHKGTIIAS